MKSGGETLPFELASLVILAKTHVIPPRIDFLILAIVNQLKSSKMLVKGFLWRFRAIFVHSLPFFSKLPDRMLENR